MRKSWELQCQDCGLMKELEQIWKLRHRPVASLILLLIPFLAAEAEPDGPR